MTKSLASSWMSFQAGLSALSWVLSLAIGALAPLWSFFITSLIDGVSLSSAPAPRAPSTIAAVTPARIVQRFGMAGSLLAGSLVRLAGPREGVPGQSTEPDGANH